jgi:hypothetical protein
LSSRTEESKKLISITFTLIFSKTMNCYKNKYHPMIILLYHSNMLSPEQMALIPPTTKSNWRKFIHQDYFGFEMVKDYIEDFDYIKEVLTKKHLKRAMKFACSLSDGYSNLIQEIEGSKKLIKKHKEQITYSIQRMAKYGKITVSDASRLFGVSKDWFYRHRKFKPCSESYSGKCFRQYPNQLTAKEVISIESIVLNPENQKKTKTTLFFNSIRKGLIVCGMSTFFKYADIVGYQKPEKAKNNKRKVGFRATRPFEWLHVDVTYVQTQNDGVQYVAFIKDNY